MKDYHLFLHFQIHHYGQQHLPNPLIFLLLFFYSTDQCFSSGRHRHPDPGLRPGLPRESVRGLVSAVPGKEALGDLYPGAESGSGRCFRVAERAVVSALPGRGEGLGVRLGRVQAGALPVQREHVCVHLPDLPNEHGPLAGRCEALSVPENEDQKVPVGLVDGGLDVSVHPLPAHAFLPEVKFHHSIHLQFSSDIFFS